MNDTWIATKLCSLSARCFVAGMTMDNNGIIYFTAHGENIYQIKKKDHINTEPHILTSINGAHLNGIVWNKNNILYICDWDNRVLSYAIDTGNLSTIAGKEGHCDGHVPLRPFGIAVDKNGDLLVTERSCVRKIKLTTETVVTVAGDGHLGEDAVLKIPFGIAMNDDTIYVGDWLNDSIRKIKDGTVSTIAVRSGKHRQDESLHHSNFCGPTGLAVDAYGNLIICCQSGLWKVDLNQKSFSALLSSMVVWSVVISNQFELFAGGKECIMKIENTWKWKRFIWIGHLKEDPNNCLLATLPRDMIKEICSLFN